MSQSIYNKIKGKKKLGNITKHHRKNTQQLHLQSKQFDFKKSLSKEKKCKRLKTIESIQQRYTEQKKLNINKGIKIKKQNKIIDGMDLFRNNKQNIRKKQTKKKYKNNHYISNQNNNNKFYHFNLLSLDEDNSLMPNKINTSRQKISKSIKQYSKLNQQIKSGKYSHRQYDKKTKQHKQSSRSRQKKVKKYKKKKRIINIKTQCSLQKPDPLKIYKGSKPDYMQFKKGILQIPSFSDSQPDEKKQINLNHNFRNNFDHQKTQNLLQLFKQQFQQKANKFIIKNYFQRKQCTNNYWKSIYNDYAMKIQKIWRGYKVRKNLVDFKIYRIQKKNWGIQTSQRIQPLIQSIQTQIISQNGSNLKSDDEHKDELIKWQNMIEMIEQLDLYNKQDIINAIRKSINKQKDSFNNQQKQKNQKLQNAIIEIKNQKQQQKEQKNHIVCSIVDKQFKKRMIFEKYPKKKSHSLQYIFNPFLNSSYLNPQPITRIEKENNLDLQIKKCQQKLEQLQLSQIIQKNNDQFQNKNNQNVQFFRLNEFMSKSKKIENIQTENQIQFKNQIDALKLTDLIVKLKEGMEKQGIENLQLKQKKIIPNQQIKLFEILIQNNVKKIYGKIQSEMKEQSLPCISSKKAIILFVTEFINYVISIQQIKRKSNTQKINLGQSIYSYWSIIHLNLQYNEQNLQLTKQLNLITIVLQTYPQQLIVSLSFLISYKSLVNINLQGAHFLMELILLISIIFMKLFSMLLIKLQILLGFSVQEEDQCFGLMTINIIKNMIDQIKY